MLSGFAKTSFIKNYQSSPWKKTDFQIVPNWPIFKKLLTEQNCSYLEYIVTQKMLEKHPQINQNIALFVCHLILAAREGHLCIKIEGDELIPTVEQLWTSETSKMPAEDAINLTKLIIGGSKQIPSEIIKKLESNSLDDSFITPICQYHNCYYLQRHWVLETILLKQLITHSNTLPKINLDSIKIKNSIQQLIEKKLLLKEQGEAIENACMHPLTLITGGPGTGKSYTASQLIRVIWENLSDGQRKNCSIALAAPTGKAVANLQKNLGKLNIELEGSVITVKTLHSLLGIKSSASNFQDTPARIGADIIIVDESSMIDVKLMVRLFESIKVGARVILLGDQHQLPSVEAGSVFLDLINYANTKKLLIPSTKLQKCMRTDLRSIIDFAQLIKEGKADQVLETLRDKLFHGIERLNFEIDKNNFQDAFLTRTKEYFPSILKDVTASKVLLELFHTIRILSPMRRGPFGVDSLNNMFWTYFSRKYQNHDGWLAVPIMIVTNDYRSNLFNGETGTLLRKLPLNDNQTNDYAIFPSSDTEDGIRKISASLLPKYEYAYCLSVHKSQGSEFEKIVLVMPEGSELFGREIFYTAVTRARKKIEIYGTDEVISKTIMQQGIRLSGISERLK
ncbi:MAG: exodeoxyribonuclease V subunit alpha [Parachlamydiaceae bacterium]|nr:exodeoxyribonuclease V subunit alpha [Parachlamydiaceae bacterium]